MVVDSMSAGIGGAVGLGASINVGVGGDGGAGGDGKSATLKQELKPIQQQR